MDAKKFTAVDMRRALQMVREHLGPDAVILSSKKMSSKEQGDYVEIIASDDYSVEEVEAEHCAAISSVAHNIYQKISEDDARETLKQQPKEKVLEHDSSVRPITEADKYQRSAQVELLSSTVIPTANTQVEALKQALLKDNQFVETLQGSREALHAKEETENEMDEMRYEIEGLRRLLQSNNQPVLVPSDVSASIRKSDKKQTKAGLPKTDLLENLRHRLELMGVPFSHHDSLLKHIEHHNSVKAAWRELMLLMQNRIQLVSRDWVDAGGIFALIGPTGAGKTTTIAKLATRYALQYGAEQIGLISLDAKRVGGVQQLQTVGKLLGVPVRVVSDSNKLDVALRTFRNRSLVLIDSAGVRPGEEAMDELLTLLQYDNRIKPLLTLPVTSQYPVLKSWLHACRKITKGLIVTKLDEAMSLGEILAAMMDSDLPLAYTTDGQLIPESIALPNLPELMSLAVEKIRYLHQFDRQSHGVSFTPSLPL